MHWRVLILSLALFLPVAAFCADSTRLRHFPTDKDILQTEQARRLLRCAQTDFYLVHRHQPPRYAMFKTMLYDGGTTFYEGRGYALTKVHRIAGFRHGKAYYETGTSISFHAPITNKDLWYSEDS
jgi:hypothetical protein